jgi:GDPmannose 4,6-dehydratase
VTDGTSVFGVIQKHRPSLIYHFAAMSHVATSFELPDQCIQVNTLGTLRLLESIRMVNGVDPLYNPRIYLAGTSEEFGNSAQIQDETTSLDPQSPYGVSKEAAYHLGKLYRSAFNMFIVIGHCFNHESPRRDVRFVTRKVTRGVAQYVTCPAKFEPIVLGNLDSSRDWTHAKDMVRGIISMTESSTKPKEYVLASGVARTVRAMVETAFALRNVQICWFETQHGIEGRCAKTDRVLIKTHSRYLRPCEVNHLCGDASMALKELGWKPEISFEAMLSEMIAADEALLSRLA